MEEGPLARESPRLRGTEEDREIGDVKLVEEIVEDADIEGEHPPTLGEYSRSLVVYVELSLLSSRTWAPSLLHWKSSEVKVNMT